MKPTVPWTAAAVLLALALPVVAAKPPVGDWFIMRTAPGGGFMSLSDETDKKGALMRGCVRRQCLWILSHDAPCVEGETTTLRLLTPKATQAPARCLGPSQINTGLHDWMFLDEKGIDALVRRGARFSVQVEGSDTVPVSAPRRFNAQGGALAFKRLEQLLVAE